jgi:predicted metal-dependent hydrolase
MIFEVTEESFKIKVNDKHIVVHIRQSGRARNIAIKVNIRGQAELVLPERITFSKAEPFLVAKLPWLIERLASREKDKVIDPVGIPIFGVLHTIQNIESRKRYVNLSNNIIEVGSDPEFQEITLIRYLKKLLLEEITILAEANALSHSLDYKNIRLSNGISTWGSCSRDGKLSFNWRLVFAPRNIMQYLVAHEMAHLEEKNHGPKFWKLVNKIYSDSALARIWLKKEGRNLYRILGNHK